MEVTKLIYKYNSEIRTYNLYKIGKLLYYFRGSLLYVSHKDIGCSYCEIYRNPKIKGECCYINENENRSDLLCRIVSSNNNVAMLYPNKMHLLINSYIRVHKLYIEQ